ncbi:MAG: ADP-heptose--LPS heptosyltransferase [Alphaproteobacteria bacterium]|nr:ADP-heptose--LPS heptosyltransferase [Alphaproteobacteria bacterium]
MSERILIIKLGALGDFVQALGPMRAIREHHGQAHLTLLTTPPFEPLAKASGWFDAIDTGGRAKGWLKTVALARRLKAQDFARIYDLQTSSRSGWLFQLMRPNPPFWSGVAFGCSHPHANPRRVPMHTIDRQAEQLLMAGLAQTPPPDLSFVTADVSRFALPSPYALLVPGGAAHRPEKRWPIGHYVTLAGALTKAGVTPVVLGQGLDEEVLAAAIEAAAPATINLVGRTSLLEIVGLARGAALAIGNDTGPMHLIATAGARSIVLFSGASDPLRCGQRGRDVTILRREDLAALSVEDVLAKAT